ncbi:hypothetical protein X743_28580 [Mesorhizobium sp. LNHC252B00]|nr:hypothetical protein X743_28580 [Mesorhizobium sp. LNHC252B00]
MARLVVTYRSPKKLNIANTMTIAPTIQMILFMITLRFRKPAPLRGLIFGRGWGHH